MKGFYICLIAVGGLLLGSCSNSGVKVSGRFVGNYDQTVYLEKMTPGEQIIVDSTATDAEGYFKMKVRLPNGEPTIYYIICNNDRIPLLLSKGDDVKLHSVGAIARNYTVQGSEGSEEMQRLNKILYSGAAKLDSILNVYNHIGPERSREINASYRSEYFKTKREQITFIVSNPGSLVSLYALYQRLPNDTDLFNGDNDIIYYKLVADSTSKYYPDSPYVRALQNEIDQVERGFNLTTLLNEKLSESPINFPDLDISDMYGTKHRLSDLTGKVILLDFWSATSSTSRLLNAELKEIYERYAASGFEVYQVAVDEDKLVWITAVQDQKLPWISVNDLRGSAGIGVMAYNISSVPANFLIDRNGDIVEKNIYGEKLSQKIKTLL